MRNLRSSKLLWRGCGSSRSQLNKFGPSEDLAMVLAHQKLNAESFVDAFTVKFRLENSLVALVEKGQKKR